MKLNLGCGLLHKEGFDNIDIDALACPDLKMKLGVDRFPYPDESVDEVVGYNILEHLYDDELLFLFRELRRVCKHDAVMEFFCPYLFSPVNGLVGHRHLMSEYSFVGMDWLVVKHRVFFGVIWYRLRGWLPLPLLLPTSIEYRMMVK